MRGRKGCSTQHVAVRPACAAGTHSLRTATRRALQRPALLLPLILHVQLGHANATYSGSIRRRLHKRGPHSGRGEQDRTCRLAGARGGRRTRFRSVCPAVDSPSGGEAHRLRKSSDRDRTAPGDAARCRNVALIAAASPQTGVMVASRSASRRSSTTSCSQTRTACPDAGVDRNQLGPLATARRRTDPARCSAPQWCSSGKIGGMR